MKTASAVENGDGLTSSPFSMTMAGATDSWPAARLLFTVMMVSLITSATLGDWFAPLNGTRPGAEVEDESTLAFVRFGWLLVLASCGSTPSVSGDRLPSSPAGTELSFEVPAGTRGLTFVVEAAVGANDFIGVQSLVDPSGREVVRDFKSVAHPARSLTGQNGSGLGVVSVPLLEDGLAMAALPSGRWTIRLGGLSGDPKNQKGATTPFTGRLEATVLRRIASERAVLDLELWIPEGLVLEGATLDASNALSTPALEQRLSLGFGLLRRLTGIERGTVQVHSLPTSFAALRSDAEIDTATRSVDSAQLAAQLVLTNQLSPEGQGELSGLSPCLPGAPATPSTPCSALVLSLRRDAPAWQEATVWVHELSHFVGLRHTTELGTPPVFDGLADTPDCLDTSKSALASCPDRNHLMFPSANQSDGLDAITLSETQRAAWATSPLAHP